jgi:hypothetical protein
MTIADLFVSSFEQIWTGFVGFLPRFLGAVLVLTIGWAIAVGIGKLVEEILKTLKLDHLVERMHLTKAFERSGVKFHTSVFFGWLVRWFFIIVFLVTATDILGWVEITEFLRTILLYIPNVIIGMVILVAGVVLGNLVGRVVEHSVGAAKFESAAMVGSLSRWALIIFSFLAALHQLRIAPELIEVLFTGFVAMLSLAGGIAFGLGGRNEAERVLERLRRDITK